MTVMTMDARAEVAAHYRSRRDMLRLEAIEDDAHRRPLRAAKKRLAALMLSRALTDEELNLRPTGLLPWWVS